MNRVDPPTEPGTAPRFIDRALNWIERAGNTLPDPAALFLTARAAALEWEEERWVEEVKPTLNFLEFDGYFKAIEGEAEQDGAMTASVTIKVCSALTDTAAA